VDPSDPDPVSGHGTGMAGGLIMPPYKNPKDGLMYQGVLQNAKVYNIRESDDDSQGSITQALQWVVDHHAQYNITAVNMTDFVGTTAATAMYDAQVTALWNAGVFVATPVANNWLGDPDSGTPPHTSIGYPGKHPYVFATGGLDANGTGVRAETQRGPLLDILAPAVNVWVPYYVPSTDEHLYVQGAGNSWGLPMVVGTAVLLQQIDPTLKPAEIMQIIQDGGVYVADTTENAQITGVAGYKRLDVLGAVKLAYQRRDDASDQGTGNDTLATATSIPLDTSGNGTIAGQKLLIHDHDYYTFSVSAAGSYDLSSIAGAQLLNAGGTVIGTVGASGVLARQSLAAGKYYVHLYNPDQSLSGTYSIDIARHTTPAIVAGTFAATPKVISLAFSKDVGASLTAADLVVTPQSGGSAISPTSVTFDKATGIARFAFATPLPDGDYHATIRAASVTDSTGQPMDADFTADFFILSGDANRDRAVDFNDLVLLAQNYNSTGGKLWTDGDFTGDGNVDFNDLVVLAQRYNTSLPAPAPPAAAPVRLASSAKPKPSNPLFSITPVARPSAQPTKRRQPAG
jgi:hypothetical protein